MNGFIKCCVFLGSIGIVAFFIGRIVPKRFFWYNKFPYKPFQYERDGDIYIKIGIRKWKEELPDMSAIMPMLMPSKRLPKKLTVNQLELMIQETCIAEWIHKLLSILGFGCMLIWKSVGGVVVSLVYLFGNIPYIIIQRYNRPKLVRLLQKQQMRETRCKA